MSKGFNTLKPKTGGQDGVRLHEVVELFQLPDNEDVTMRFLSTPILPVKQHWIKIYAGKDRREISIPKYCIAFDPENEDTPKEGVHCPYCDISTGKDGSARASVFYLANAIIRDIQEDEPAKKIKPTESERKTGFKDIKSKSWTPVRVVRITSTVASRLQELGQRNIHKNKKTDKKVAYDVTDNKYGRDVIIKYKPKASGTDKYSCDADSKSPLTEEEQGYLVWELSNKLLEVTGLETEKQAKESFKRMSLVGGEEIEDDEEEEEGLDFSDKKGKGKKGGKKQKALDEDDEDSNDNDSDDDDDPFEERSSKKKKKKSKFDSDEDDDEPRSKKKKSKSKFDDDDEEEERFSKKKKKKSNFDEDEDDDDYSSKKGKKSKSKYDLDDEDEEEERSSKKKKKKSKFDSDEDYDDEEEERSSKKKKKKKTNQF